MSRLRSLLPVVVAVPCAAFAVLSGWWLAGRAAGGGLWPPDEVTLAEAVATRNNAEALRLIHSGTDPNAPARVRAGLLGNRDLMWRPVEAAVGAQRADVLRMLLANGATIDAQEMRVLRCYEQIRRDSGVREILGGEDVKNDCAGVRLPNGETAQ